MRRGELRSGYPAAAASVFAFTYIALPMGMLVQLREQCGGGVLSAVSAAGGLGGRHFRLLRGQVDGAAFDGAAHQSEEDVGRRGGFARRQASAWDGCCFVMREQISSALLHSG